MPFVATLFIVLYSDEGNPQTGEKATGRPESQRMSQKQFEWLKETLTESAGAWHVFVFLHHPRWLGGGYGETVGKALAARWRQQVVRAVFAGHIHRMRHDGVRDGIDRCDLRHNRWLLECSNALSGLSASLSHKSFGAARPGQALQPQPGSHDGCSCGHR